MPLLRRFALLLVIRGLDQLGIEPVDLSHALDRHEIDLQGRGVRSSTLLVIDRRHAAPCG